MSKKDHSFSEINRNFPGSTTGGKISYLYHSLLVLKKVVFNDTSHWSDVKHQNKERGLGMTRTNNPLDDLYILKLTYGTAEWRLDSVSHWEIVGGIRGLKRLQICLQMMPEAGGVLQNQLFPCLPSNICFNCRSWPSNMMSMKDSWKTFLSHTIDTQHQQIPSTPGHPQSINLLYLKKKTKQNTAIQN